jgi:hypothetical protein
MDGRTQRWLPSCPVSMVSRRVIGSFSCFAHGPAPRHRQRLSAPGTPLPHRPLLCSLNPASC